MNGAVINVTTHFDSQATEQRRILLERNVQSGAVKTIQPIHNIRLQFRSERNGAFHSGGTPLDLQFNQSLKMQKDRHVMPRFNLGYFADDLPHTVLIQNAICETTAEQFLRFASGLFGNLHFSFW